MLGIFSIDYQQLCRICSESESELVIQIRTRIWASNSDPNLAIRKTFGSATLTCGDVEMVRKFLQAFYAETLYF